MLLTCFVYVLFLCNYVCGPKMEQEGRKEKRKLSFSKLLCVCVFLDKTSICHVFVHFFVNKPQHMQFVSG